MRLLPSYDIWEGSFNWFRETVYVPFSFQIVNFDGEKTEIETKEYWVPSSTGIYLKEPKELVLLSENMAKFKVGIWNFFK